MEAQLGSAKITVEITILQRLIYAMQWSCDKSASFVKCVNLDSGEHCSILSQIKTAGFMFMEAQLGSEKKNIYIYI